MASIAPSKENIITENEFLDQVSLGIAAKLSEIDPLWASFSSLDKNLRLVLLDKKRYVFFFAIPVGYNLVWDQQKQFVYNLTSAVRQIFEHDAEVVVIKTEDKEQILESYIATYQDRSAEVLQADQHRGPRRGLQENRQASQAIVIEPVEKNLRDLITQPNRVVVVPGYITRWVPYIGPVRASILVGFFQAYYQAHGSCATHGIAFEASGPQIAALSGISVPSFWRHIGDRELEVFIKRVPFGPDESLWVENPKTKEKIRQPNRYQFQTILPLTPGDAKSLRAFLERAGIRKDPEAALRNIIAQRIEPKDVFDFPAKPSEPDWLEKTKKFEGPAELILNMIAGDEIRYRKDIMDMASEIAARLMPAKDQLHLPLYFLIHWQPIIGNGPCWIINLTRDRCYYNRVTGELRDREYLEGGFEELAQAIGFSRTKTIRGWFPVAEAKREDNSDEPGAERTQQLRALQANIARFATVIDPEMDRRRQVYAFTMQVAMHDPLTPTHERLYSNLVDVLRRYSGWESEKKGRFLAAFETAEKALRNLGADDTQLLNNMGVFDMLMQNDLGANDRQLLDNLGAFDKNPSPDLGVFFTDLEMIVGAFDMQESEDLAAFDKQSARFWALMIRLNLFVMNLFKAKALKNLFKHLEENTTTTTPDSAVEENEDKERDEEEDVVVDVFHIGEWEVSTLLEAGNIVGRPKQELIAKGVTAEAIVSCYVYLASEAGGNLGTGFIVSQLRNNPQTGQGGNCLKLAQLPPMELISLIERQIQYGSASSGQKLWQRTIGNPSFEKLLSLVERLGLDREEFESLRSY